MTDSTTALTDEAKVLVVKLKKSLGEKELEVAMLPDIARRVLILADDPKSDAQKLAQLIQSDQSLAGHVMRIANSAAYSPSASLLSLQQAIARLGMNLINEIALAATVNSKLFNIPGFEGHLKEIWHHALLTAFWAKEISRAAKRSVEASFLCGLLHSIGRPVVLQSSLEMARRLKISLSKEEHLRIEMGLHRMFSGAVIEHWGMPLLIQEAVAYMDNYQAAPHYRDQAATVNAAAAFANHTRDPGKFPAESLGELEVLGDLNLYRDEIEGLLNMQAKVMLQVDSLHS